MVQLGSKESVHKIMTKEQTKHHFSRFNYRLDDLVAHLAIEHNVVVIKERNCLKNVLF